MRAARLSRRLLLSLPMAGLVGGCASDAGRINSLVFGAARKDPLFLWRPAWSINVSDMESPLGGFLGGNGSLTHDLKAYALPTTAISDATDVALASGWRPRSDGIGFTKSIPRSALKLWVTLSLTSEIQVLSMTFSGLNA